MEGKQNKMSKIEIIDCSHLDDDSVWYEAIYYDGKVHKLCKCCYGEIMLTILDNLKNIKVTVK